MAATGKDGRIPLYRQVYETLRDEIAQRRLPPNSPFLTENEAIARFSISRITVRQAFELLEREGLIYRIQGKGALIAPPEARPVKTVAFLATCIVTSGVESVIMRAVEQHLDDNGINLIVCNTDNSFEKATSYVKRLSRSNIDAIVYVPITRDDEKDSNAAIVEYVRNNGIPVVLVDRYVEELEAQSYVVTPDNYNGSYSAAEHLLALGHKQIGTVRVSHSTSTDNRLAGIAQALADHGIADNPEYHYEVVREEDYKVIAMRLRMMENPPTALLALNDDLAYGLIDALHEYNIAVPEDMAIIGFDDYSTRKPKYPVNLTTVRVPLWEEGKLAASIVVDLLEGRRLEPFHARVQCELTVRDTCGARGRRQTRSVLRSKGETAAVAGSRGQRA